MAARNRYSRYQIMADLNGWIVYDRLERVQFERVFTTVIEASEFVNGLEG